MVAPAIYKGIVHAFMLPVTHDAVLDITRLKSTYG
jgi:hypothetical protein